jgi:DtxR family Mn-dependent transcriptional regulator
MSFAHLVFSSDGVRPLAALAERSGGIVVDIVGGDPHRVDRLLALGVAPGACVTMLQRYPGIVFLCDQTELAVEREVAEAILIRPTEGQS